MKIVLWIVAGMLMCNAAVAQHCYVPAVYPNEPAGFRGIAWGTDIANRPDMKRHSVDRYGHGYYIRRCEQMVFGSAKAAAIAYRTYHGRLDTGFVHVLGAAHEAALLATLRHRYGNAPQRDSTREEAPAPHVTLTTYLWDGKTTRIYLVCTYKHDCSLLISGMSVLREEKRHDFGLARYLPPICKKPNSSTGRR